MPASTMDECGLPVKSMDTSPSSQNRVCPELRWRRPSAWRSLPPPWWLSSPCRRSPLSRRPGWGRGWRRRPACPELGITSVTPSRRPWWWGHRQRGASARRRSCAAGRGCAGRWCRSDGGHESLLHAERVVQHLHHGARQFRQEASISHGARGIAFVLVDAQHDGDVLALRRALMMTLRARSDVRDRLVLEVNWPVDSTTTDSPPSSSILVLLAVHEYSSRSP